MSLDFLKIVAPMVDHSDYGWRILSNRYNADMCYTEMIHSESFLRSPKKYNFFTGEYDGQLVVQICGNNAERMYEASRLLIPYAKYIDINLGCPQNVARKGRYGAYLQYDFMGVSDIIKAVSRCAPVTCKIRILDNLDKTLSYSNIIQDSGCKMLAVHGRTIHQKGINTGLANWNIIREIKQHMNIPVISNGNILNYNDIIKCIEYTGCDGVMVAESHLENPTIFTNKEYNTFNIFNEYISICENIENAAKIQEIRCHAFRIFKRIANRFTHIRDNIAMAKTLNQFYILSEEIENIIDNSDLTEKQKKDIKILKATPRGERIDNYY